MLSQPSVLRMLEIVQESLKLRIVPAVSDREALVTLGTIDAVLSNVIRRQGEGAWMEEETRNIISVVELSPLTALSDVSQALLAELAVRNERDDPAARYHKASTILAEMVEREMENDGRLSAEVVGLLAARSARETIISGDFQTVGKT